MRCVVFLLWTFALVTSANYVFQVSIDGRGYAFAYDDVNSAEGKDQSGFVNDPNPDTLTVTFGGP